MKMKYMISIILGLVFWMGCSDDENLSPSDVPEYEITLPQGEHEYDDRIVNWFDRTGVYILYKFNPADAYFNVDQTWAEAYRDTSLVYTWYTFGEGDYVENNTAYVDGVAYELGISFKTDGSWFEYSIVDGKLLEVEASFKNSGTFSVQEADEAYVGDQLALLEELFLNFYPDSILHNYMPLKVLLGRELKRSAGTDLSYTSVFNNLILSYGDESITTLTVEKKKELKVDLHMWFINERLKEKLSFVEFFEAADYSWVGGSYSDRPAKNECYGLGFVVWPSSYINLDIVQDEDLSAYLEMIIGNSYETLTAEPENGDYNANDYTGILHLKKDVNEKIKERYDILIQEFKRLGVDLQAIGNRVVKN